MYRGEGGRRPAQRGIRRLLREARADLGRSPVVLFMDDRYGVMAVEELLSAVGFPTRQGLRSVLDTPSRPPGPA